MWQLRGPLRSSSGAVVGPLAPENAAEREFGLIWSQERGYGMFAIGATCGGNRVLRSTRWRAGDRMLRSTRWRAGNRMLRSTRWRVRNRMLRSARWGGVDRVLRSTRISGLKPGGVVFVLKCGRSGAPGQPPPIARSGASGQKTSTSCSGASGYPPSTSCSGAPRHPHPSS